jgi:hypothetical protein
MYGFGGFVSSDGFYVFGCFVPTGVLSAGRFVSSDVLSLRTFCPLTLCYRTFRLRTFVCMHGYKMHYFFTRNLQRREFSLISMTCQGGVRIRICSTGALQNYLKLLWFVKLNREKFG